MQAIHQRAKARRFLAWILIFFDLIRIQKTTRMYAKIERVRAKEKPTATPIIVANTEPKTEVIPFTAQAKGTFLSSIFNNLIPEGKGIPMKNPNGNKSAKVERILCSRVKGNRYLII